MSDAEGDTWATSGYGGHRGPQVVQAELEWISFRPAFVGANPCVDPTLDFQYRRVGRVLEWRAVETEGGVAMKASPDDEVRRLHPERVAEVAVVGEDD